jgi:hypothetical protein
MMFPKSRTYPISWKYGQLSAMLTVGKISGHLSRKPGIHGFTGQMSGMLALAGVIGQMSHK